MYTIEANSLQSCTTWRKPENGGASDCGSSSVLSDQVWAWTWGKESTDSTWLASILILSFCLGAQEKEQDGKLGWSLESTFNQTFMKITKSSACSDGLPGTPWWMHLQILLQNNFLPSPEHSKQIRFPLITSPVCGWGKMGPSAQMHLGAGSGGERVGGKGWDAVMQQAGRWGAGKLPSLEESLWAVVWIHSNPKHINSSPSACTHTTWMLEDGAGKTSNSPGILQWCRIRGRRIMPASFMTEGAALTEVTKMNNKAVSVMRQSLCYFPVSFPCPIPSWGSWFSKPEENSLIIQCRWLTRCGARMGT